jgi:calcium permeable stress-gated cation channel
VERDQVFQRAQQTRWQPAEDDEHRSLNSELEAKEKQEQRESQMLEERDEQNRRASKALHTTESYEMKNLEKTQTDHHARPQEPRKPSWADQSRSRSRSHSHHNKHRKNREKSVNPLNKLTEVVRHGVDDVLNDVSRPVRDIEAQVLPTANLFDDIDDTLEDIEPEARQKLIKRSFQHPATRAIQPAIWIPHDELGIAKDEIQRTSRFSDKIWITSVNARVDASGKVLYKGLPPDRDPFENIEV